MKTLPTATPESCGLPSAAIQRLLDAMQDFEFHTFVLTVKNKVVASGAYAPYTPDCTPGVYSCSKNFCATAAGIAIGEGLFTLEDRMCELFPEEMPENPSAFLQQLTVHDCLCMATGHETDAFGYALRPGNKNELRTFFSLPIGKKPDTHFVYNTAATYAIGRLITKKTGLSVHAYLQPRLFEPLGIHAPKWEKTSQGYDIGGSGLHVSADGMARLALLYLNDGVWEGKRILPQDFVRRATRVQVANHYANQVKGSKNLAWDWGQGYGYQFWMCRHGGYRGDGAYGQFNCVFPQHRVTFSSTGMLPTVLDMQRFLDAFYLLLDQVAEAPLPQAPAANAALAARLQGLQVVPCGQPCSPMLAEVNGKRYVCTDNPLGLGGFSLIAMDPADPAHCDRLALQLDFDEAPLTLACGAAWQVADLAWRSLGKTAVRATWADMYTLRLQLRPLDEVHVYELNMAFSPGVCRLQWQGTPDEEPTAQFNGQALA